MAKTLKEMLNCSDDRKVREWLRIAPRKDVEGFIAGSSPGNLFHRHAINERDRRYAFWARIIAVFTMIFAAIAALPVIVSWFRH